MGSDQMGPSARERVRGIVSAVFRRRATVLASFLVLASLATLAAYVQPVRYSARLRLLITRDRVDAVVTPAQEGAGQPRPDVSDKDLQSEAQVLQSRDLLRGVAASCQIALRPSWQARTVSRLKREPESPPDVRLDRLVMDMSRTLQVAVVEKSNLIEVAYSAPTPLEAHCVLEALSREYVEKHLSLQRPAGTLRFFQEAAAGYRRSLDAAESKLREFGQALGTGAVDLQTDLKVRKLGDAESLVRETRAGIAELTERSETLQAQLNAAPERRTTQVRTADNGILMERLQSTLLDLELKRTALAARYEPNYLPLQDLVRQIDQTRAAITAANQSPLVDRTTDSDPTHDWLRSESARTRAELAALTARASAAGRTVAAYRDEIRALSDKAIEHQDLERQVKAQEETYLLYLRKQEEARIAQALDSQGITNVVIAEAPNVPKIPTSLRMPVWLAGMFCAAVAALLLGLAVDLGDGTFRTSQELRQTLGVPVLASFPRGAVPAAAHARRT